MEGVKSKQITIGLTALAMLFFLSYIYFASTLNALGYELERKTAARGGLGELENKLRLELAQRQSPEYLLAYAGELNLVEIGSISTYIDGRVAIFGRAER